MKQKTTAEPARQPELPQAVAPRSSGDDDPDLI